MTYTQDGTVFYTDGLCFTDGDKPLPGLVLNNHDVERPSMFALNQGIWWVPASYRICLYTANEILNNTFLDITKRLIVPPNTFLYLEKELVQPGIISGLPDELYFDLTFFIEDELRNFLEEDLSLIHTGNLSCWKNPIQIMDWIYG